MLFIACHEFLSCGFQVGGMAGHDHRNGRGTTTSFCFFGGGGMRFCGWSVHALTQVRHIMLCIYTSLTSAYRMMRKCV